MLFKISGNCFIFVFLLTHNTHKVLYITFLTMTNAIDENTHIRYYNKINNIINNFFENINIVNGFFFFFKISYFVLHNY